MASWQKYAEYRTVYAPVRETFECGIIINLMKTRLIEVEK